MQRSWTAVLAATLVLATSVSVMAQPPQPGGGRGFGGGFGGFGGNAMLLGMEAVQKELALTDAQKETFTKLREEARAGFGGGANFRDMSDEERAKLRTQMEERAKKTEETIKSTLDEKQYARLNELSIQQAGVMALARPEVADKLKLSDDQKSKIREVAGAGRGGPGGGSRGGFNPNASAEERAKAMEEARARREKQEADVMAVLNDEQKKSFEEMKGKKFEFPAFGGFGGRPGAGNRPPRDAN